ncbi:MAG TPA: tubulin-like doman-containing protein, partial [Gemmata sp.]|nr:tubulin-like doman-containing protein [Gemmata sp.]
MAIRIEAHAEPIPGYRLLTRLGSGGFGDVWKAEAPGGIFKAIKIIHGDLRSENSDLVRYAEQELKSLKRVQQVRHPYLLALDRYDIVDGRLMIVMELADCNLWDRFRECRNKGMPGIPREELLLYMLEIAEVLDLFDDRFQLQHLDIKPQNLFLLHNHVKVADFGQVKDLQGFSASVTGGITPVYAAPETFDGIITRYCDQYSLACVYQELLTGVRPFDGGTINQLFMQHLNLPPNLAPSPPEDRPALARALAKRPEERWSKVTDFVQALLGPMLTPGRGATASTRVLRESTVRPAAPAAPDLQPVSTSALLVEDTPPPLAMADTISPVAAFVPPESPGPGSLQPALVIGLGQAGLRVLQRFRYDLTERYGAPELLPLIRTLYVDTDPEALADAARDRPQARRAGMRPTDVFAAKLNRASHYLKPRFNGQTLTEGWFDPQLLYKIPRNSVTLGVRLFGRLAFCDHSRPLIAKVQSELEAAMAGDSFARTESRTGLQCRTNRPRVYVVAGLAGGTGGGMFLDVAYTVRARLRRMGYENPDVVGVLIAPPADPALSPPQWLGNTYAALTELHHYTRPDTVFAANYDDQAAVVRDKNPPFTHCYVLGSHAPVSELSGGSSYSAPAMMGAAPPAGARPRVIGSGVVTSPTARAPRPSREAVIDPSMMEVAFRSFSDAAELIRLNLLTPVGRTVAERRAESTDASGPPPGPTVATFGMSGYDWPRAEVLARTTARIARALLKRWAAPDVRRSREVVPALAQQKWSHLGLDPEALQRELRAAANRAAGEKVEDQVARLTEPLLPRGWLSRLPEPQAVSVALDRLVALLGPPSSVGERAPTPVEAAMGDAADARATSAAREIGKLVPSWVNDPRFRVSGAEEMIRQFLATTDRVLEQFAVASADQDGKAQAAFELVSRYVYYQKGERKPPAAEFADAVKTYPQSRLQAATYRAVVAVYRVVRETLALQLYEVATARQRLDEAASAAEARAVGAEPYPRQRRLMPAGCATLDAAVAKFVAAVTDPELTEIDGRVEAALDPELHGVFVACLRSAVGPDRVVAAVYEETRAYLDARLGQVDLAAMFRDRFRTPHQAERAVEDTFHDAEPALL